MSELPEKQERVDEKDEKSGSSSPSNSEQRDQNDDNSSSSNSDSLSSEMVEEGEGKDKKLVRYKYVPSHTSQCCKICKHPDKSKKACVCVVPLSQRRADLGSGCRNCGCMGCSKEDYISKGEDPQYHPQAKDAKTPVATKVDSGVKKPQKREKQRDRSRSNPKKKTSPRRKSRKSQSRSRSPQIIDTFSMKFHNFDRSIIGNLLVNDFQVNPNLLGFAIPQRTYSYIFGKPR